MNSMRRNKKWEKLYFQKQKFRRIQTVSSRMVVQMELTGERQYIHNVSQIRKENYLEEDDL